MINNIEANIFTHCLLVVISTGAQGLQGPPGERGLPGLPGPAVSPPFSIRGDVFTLMAKQQDKCEHNTSYSITFSRY